MSITTPSPVGLDDGLELSSGELSNGAATNLLDHKYCLAGNYRIGATLSTSCDLPVAGIACYGFQIMRLELV